MLSKSNGEYGKFDIYTSNPDTAVHPNPIVIVPGFSETITHTQKLVDTFEAHGYFAVAYSQPRRNGFGADPIQRLGAIVNEVLHLPDLRGQKVHAVAHSLGSAAVLEAARANPYYFKSIMLNEPVGMVENQGIVELGWRSLLKSRHEDKLVKYEQSPDVDRPAQVDTELAADYKRRLKQTRRAGSLLIAQQIPLAYHEALAAGAYHMDIPKSITERTHPKEFIPVHAVFAKDDELFDYKQVAERLRANNPEGFASLSTIADPLATHNTFWMQPERTVSLFLQLHQAAA